MINKTVYLDTETTDKTPGQICQLTYIVEQNGCIVKRVNQYFKVDGVEAGASKVTGLTKELLETLSEGTIFERRAEEFYSDLTDAIIVGHNISFDAKFISAEMARLGKSLNLRPLFCTMNFSTNILKLPGKYGKYKWPNLGEVLRFLNISEQQVEEFTQRLYGNWKMDAHDARFDTVAVYLAVKEFERRGLLNVPNQAIGHI